jgi:hypothetical protein
MVPRSREMGTRRDSMVSMVELLALVEGIVHIKVIKETRTKICQRMILNHIYIYI